MKNLAFPITVVGLTVLAFFVPSLFVGLKGYITPLLMLIMLGMGLTLEFEDFYKVIKKKKALVAGVCLQFIIMPFLAFILAKILGFSNELTIGMMLVGAAAGGTSSNVITYLAKGDVALSVSMTFASTLLSIGLMPFLTWIYIGEKIDVPAMDMFISLVKIILIPIGLGVVINRFFSKFVSKISAVLPIISMGGIVFIVAIVVALNHKNIQTVGAWIFVAVILHNICGYLLGYIAAKALKFDEKTARTIGIEVGMQNSGLSVALAIKYFTPLSALPGAIFSVWHNISGSLLASYWSSKKV
ncbi:bile acid:sodium symporter family protein [Campylobacter geochelonis]|uniref:Sodium-dependent transporter n=1 Tax=Campylobacter geochelonis TaxID=1780362 RepID=A0A128EF34_9BACT|nr:bile acid:sodium symporter family protein [Campylobacter geochelonis]QKF72033.1 bile acid:sodium symporter family protein [Campylobacter geochelonis]CZE46868.1 sodium-dependent transporter [Campylobacter geochelonis]